MHEDSSTAATTQLPQPASKHAARGQVLEGGEHRTGVYKEVHEDSSTAPTTQLPPCRVFYVPEALHGQRFDTAIAHLYPSLSRSQLSLWIKEGQLTLNQGHCKPREKVATGDEIEFLIALSASENRHEKHEGEAIPLDILYEDEAILVLNKPAGLCVHPGAGQREHTLLNALLYHNPLAETLPRAGIVHRLDKDTSGLLVVAKTLESHAELIRQMQARSINRHYIALVQGHVISGGKIETAYGRDSKNRLKMAVRTHGREAITLYTLKKQYQTYTLLDVQLLTGRTHQIRVHMAHIKHPLVGDVLYGGRMIYPKGADAPLREALQHFKRQALHAASLSFYHPRTLEHLAFTAPLPEDLTRLLALLDKK